jgi:hypothetical protein
MKRHEFLSEASNTYLKSDDQLLEYGQCIGFRYNISGRLTILNTYMCLMETNGQCISEVSVISSTVDTCIYLDVNSDKWRRTMQSAKVLDARISSLFMLFQYSKEKA